MYLPGVGISGVLETGAKVHPASSAAPVSAVIRGAEPMTWPVLFSPSAGCGKIRLEVKVTPVRRRECRGFSELSKKERFKSENAVKGAANGLSGQRIHRQGERASVRTQARRTLLVARIFQKNCANVSGIAAAASLRFQRGSRQVKFFGMGLEALRLRRSLAGT